MTGRRHGRACRSRPSVRSDWGATCFGAPTKLPYWDTVVLLAGHWKAGAATAKLARRPFRR